MFFIRKADFAFYFACGGLLIVSAVNGWRPYQIIMFNQTIQTFSPQCRMNASFADSQIFDIHVEFLKNIRNPYVHTEIYFESDRGKYDMEIVNRTINLCEFYKNKRYEPIVQGIYKVMESFLIHWHRSCPVTKGVYYVNKVVLNVEKLPPIFPEKAGSISLTVLDEHERFYHIKVLFRITRTYKTKS